MVAERVRSANNLVQSHGSLPAPSRKPEAVPVHTGSHSRALPARLPRDGRCRLSAGAPRPGAGYWSRIHHGLHLGQGTRTAAKWPTPMPLQSGVTEMPYGTGPSKFRLNLSCFT